MSATQSKIPVTCGSCQRSFRVPGEYAGRRGLCPGCRGLVRVPQVATSPLLPEPALATRAAAYAVLGLALVPVLGPANGGPLLLTLALAPAVAALSAADALTHPHATGWVRSLRLEARVALAGAAVALGMCVNGLVLLNGSRGPSTVLLAAVLLLGLPAAFVAAGRLRKDPLPRRLGQVAAGSALTLVAVLLTVGVVRGALNGAFLASAATLGAMAVASGVAQTLAQAAADAAERRLPRCAPSLR